MRVTVWLKTGVLMAAFCLVGLSLYAQDQQQQSSQQQTGDPVADAARKAREQKKNAPKPKKVFTEDDISPRLPESTPQGQSTSTSQQQGSGSAQATQEKAAAGTTETKEDPETVWRKRFKEQREKIAKAEKELDILQREIDKGQMQYYSDPQKALQQQNTRKDINEKTAQITAKKQEIANLKQQLDDMEGDLRKSGGDPGWARE